MPVFLQTDYLKQINRSKTKTNLIFSGDFDYKTKQDLPDNEQLVSPEPDVTVVTRDPANDNYILVACDGIYDVMENDHLKDFITERYTSGKGSFLNFLLFLTVTLQ